MVDLTHLLIVLLLMAAHRVRGERPPESESRFWHRVMIPNLFQRPLWSIAVFVSLGLAGHAVHPLLWSAAAAWAGMHIPHTRFQNMAAGAPGRLWVKMTGMAAVIAARAALIGGPLWWFGAIELQQLLVFASVAGTLGSIGYWLGFRTPWTLPLVDRRSLEWSEVWAGLAYAAGIVGVLA